MNVDQLAEQYRAKTDEERLQLASQLGQLTMEAQSILRGELSKRRIDIPPGSALQRSATERKHIVRGAQEAKVQPIREFVPAVLTLYHTHMWLFLKLMAPTVVLVTVAWLISRYEQYEIARQVVRGGGSLFTHPLLLLQATLMGLTRNLVSWCAFCFSFAIICAVVEQVESEYPASISESFEAVRHRLGPLLQLCLLLEARFSW